MASKFQTFSLIIITQKYQTIINSGILKKFGANLDFCKLLASIRFTDCLLTPFRHDTLLLTKNVSLHIKYMPRLHFFVRASFCLEL